MHLFKKRTIRDVVNSVLEPRSYIGSKSIAKKQHFNDFMLNSSDEDFNKAISFILDDKEIQNSINQYNTEIEELFNKPVFNGRNMSISRLILFYKTILLKNITIISQIKKHQSDIDNLLMQGKYEAVEDIIDSIENRFGFSVWSINVRIIIYLAKNDYSNLQSFFDDIKNKTSEPLFTDILRVTGWKSQAVDADIIIETMVRRSTREFIEGNALDIAAIYSLFCAPYPLYDDVDFSHALIFLQTLNVIDLYLSIIKITTYCIAHNDFNNIPKSDLIDLFEALNNEVYCHKHSNIISILKSTPLAPLIVNVDTQINHYTQGEYEFVINDLEKNLLETKNIVTKINIYAKSYVHLKRRPSNLPSLLTEIINNLISIYSLENTNQLVSQQVNLAIKFSSIELSEHLLISILKAAPNYFSDECKHKIITNSRFFDCSLTPLSYNLEKPPALYSSNSSEAQSSHLKLKHKAIDALYNKTNEAESLINEYYFTSPIKKDAIELKTELYISTGNITDLISFSAEELISNPNSNICIPLDKIVQQIYEDCIYSIDSVICCYYYNKLSKVDNSSILNEVFEEYIISLGITRPSEMISSELDNKHLFLLNEVSKVEVMDYLGCFDDDNELKIERINLLNRLVSYGYLEQRQIDTECKNLLDDILIENQAAKFNNAKIFVDTKYIYEKRKEDVKSLLLQYREKETSIPPIKNLTMESKTILKGDKNEIMLRLIKILLVDFMNNKEVGLDKNLSSEIRHGFFGNLMCSKLQNRNLLTELNEDGRYSSNEYWMDYYQFINSSILENIDNILIGFSNDFNALIEGAEKWMNVSLDEDENERLFYFIFSMEDINRLKIVMDNTLDPIGVTQFIFQLFHEKLQTCLNNVRQKLNTDFAESIDALFSKLLEEINIHKQGTGLIDLLNQIRLANTEVKEDIHTICEWFSFKKSIDFESFELQQSVKLAERCFKQINNCNIDININSDSNFTVDGTHLYAIVFTMINCFNNAFKYSSSSESIDVNIHSLGEYNFCIRISNSIDHKLDRDTIKNKLTNLSGKLSTMNDSSLLTNEGGSGLYKSLHSLKMVSNCYTLEPSIIDDIFTVEITYDHGNTCSRR
ncbi:hypothetical protein ACJ5ZS_16220 [Aeromonas salmonicida]|uniref:hypothetical protein n=1 Tax=Aeromonas salmonicida TaxID=645 RepID=UPI0038BE0A30